jgi:acetylornithine deacetylase/succinyl-diaminopimelate desuccinylase-like protein
VKQNKELLKADVILISDTSMLSLQTPSMDVGVRGLSYIRVEVTGPNRDLHSGTYGGAVANPIVVLCNMIASLHDHNNHITIPGFYDDVVVATEEERKLMAEAPFDEAEYKQDLGVKRTLGRKRLLNKRKNGHSSHA